jgi:pimeloyl-ACP methyl ester carboxylesterase
MPEIAAASEPAQRAEPVARQCPFDPPEPTAPVRQLPLPSGRAVRFVDLGAPGWRTVVFFGGLGTSARAALLTEFARTTRERLALRLISVERNGFGQTPLDSSLGYDAAAEDVLAVLSALGVWQFCVVAFSGGGPYAAALAARVRERVISLHLAAAAAGSLIASCGSAAARFADAPAVAAEPASIWEFPAGSAIHLIPGFAEAARREGEHALGCGGGAAALEHEWQLLSSAPLPDLARLAAPAYLYWGGEDDVVPLAHLEAWRRSLPNVVAVRLYEHEAHDIQYRHWNEILLDAAGLAARDGLCRDWSWSSS